jgi:hypothetical protein
MSAPPRWRAASPGGTPGRAGHQVARDARELAGQDHALATGVDPFVGGRGRVPELARQSRSAAFRNPWRWSWSWQMNMTYGRSPSAKLACCHRQHREVVVSPELLVVLVDTPCSVVLDEKHAPAVAVGPRHLEHRVGAHESRGRIAEPFRGPVVADPQHALLCLRSVRVSSDLGDSPLTFSSPGRSPECRVLGPGLVGVLRGGERARRGASSVARSEPAPTGSRRWGSRRGDESRRRGRSG